MRRESRSSSAKGNTPGPPKLGRVKPLPQTPPPRRTPTFSELPRWGWRTFRALLTRYPEKYQTDFHRTNSTGALWTETNASDLGSKGQSSRSELNTLEIALYMGIEMYNTQRYMPTPVFMASSSVFIVSKVISIAVMTVITLVQRHVLMLT